jgi:hypothetical protein
MGFVGKGICIGTVRTGPAYLREQDCEDRFGRYVEGSTFVWGWESWVGVRLFVKIVLVGTYRGRPLYGAGRAGSAYL